MCNQSNYLLYSTARIRLWIYTLNNLICSVWLYSFWWVLSPVYFYHDLKSMWRTNISWLAMWPGDGYLRTVQSSYKNGGNLSWCHFNRTIQIPFSYGVLLTFWQATTIFTCGLSEVVLKEMELFANNKSYNCRKFTTEVSPTWRSRTRKSWWKWDERTSGNWINSEWRKTSSSRRRPRRHRLVSWYS